MSLRAYSDYFLMLCNHIGMVVPCAFHSCWRLFAFNQIQLDAYCVVVWRFEATFKLQPVIPIFERNKMTECPRKPWQPTSVRITWLIQSFSMQSACSVSYRFFLPLVCFLSVFFPGDSQYYEEDTVLWIGPDYCLNNVNWKLLRCHNICLNFPVTSSIQ